MRQTLTLCRDHWDYYRTGPAVPRRLESLTAYRSHCNVGPDFLCRLYLKVLWIKKSLLLLLLFVSHYVFCGIACEQQSYFRLSLLSLRKMTSDLIGQHQNKRFYVTEIVLPLGFADVNFSEGEKRRPEIRLLFAGYYGTDKDYFGGVDRYLGQGLGRHPGRYIGRVSVDILYKIHDPILFL